MRVLFITLIYFTGLGELLLEEGRRQIVNQFEDDQILSDQEGPHFNNLLVDKNTGMVYIGAVNKLYQLSPNLEPMINAVTGPHSDSPLCSVLPECFYSVEKKLTDNVNKALLIDYSDSQLISCGSLFQGVCTMRSLRNISNIEQEHNEPVVANNAAASTVAFIAPGPPNPLLTQVMYVGVTYTGKGPYRSEVPAVSSRSLHSNSLFQIAQTAVTTGTRMFVNSLARERYPINYVYGFDSEGFSYFLTTQMKQTSPSSYHSKLVRVCHDDSDYYSYTEVPIHCISGQDSEDYTLVQAAYVDKPGSDLAADLGVTIQDDVLFAVFSTPDASEGDATSKPSNKSALCVYSLKSIRQTFLSNIQRCFKGEGARGLDFISPSLKCIDTRLTQIGEQFCGLDVNTPLGGELPITQTPVLTFDALLTAVTATSTRDSTVAFIGTSEGHMKKAVVESASSSIEYADMPLVPGSAVRSNLLFDLPHEHVYVMTDKKVSKVRVKDCEQYTDCKQCLGVKDPFCGWCSLEDKCSLRRDCGNEEKDSLHWKSYKSGQCTTITSVNPAQLQRTTARTLQLVIENLPSPPGQLLCAFSALGKVLLTNATRTTTGVSCTTPRNDLLPFIPSGESHFTSKLSVRAEKGPDLVATNFNFFDCNAYKSCTTCVSSLFPCDWCVDGHRCTHDTSEYCRNDILVTGVNRLGPSIRSGPDFCPRVNATPGGSSEILVSSGLQKSIRVKVDHIAQFIIQTRFVCQFNIEGRVTSVNAQLLSDTIYCDEMEFTYTSRTPIITATFAVIWGQSKPLDNPDNIHILIYRCQEMADNCGMCLSLEEKYQCGWCQASQSCALKEQCGTGDSISWLNRDKTCPNPSVTEFEPAYGPWEGGTNITIYGVNLGKKFEDIARGVTVAGMVCVPYQDLYEPPSKIVCRVDGPGTREKRRGPIIVKVANFRGESKNSYEFVDPVINDIEPRHGPQSGGTRVKIKGEYLDAGSHVEATIGHLPCKIIEAQKKHAICITSESNRKQKLDVKMSFDHGRARVLERKRYEYVEDPKIEFAFGGNSGKSKISKGIPSGGIKITVVGTNFEYIQDPEIYVLHAGEKYKAGCKVTNNTQMFCHSPPVATLSNSNWLNIETPEPIRLDYGFIMDHVEGVRNLSSHLKVSRFVYYYPDPEFFKFDDPNEIKLYKSNYLVLNGINLNRAAKETDIRVDIGTEICRVTSVSSSQLTCQPPDHQPPAVLPDGREDPNQLPDVVVMVGDKLSYTLGKLDYN